MDNTIVTDDQPVAAGFFHSGMWLTDYITPEALEVQALHSQLTHEITNVADRLSACWSWVAHEIQYKPLIYAQIQIQNKVSTQTDYWQTPSMCIQTRVGNCANKAILLTSLLRNDLSPQEVHCVLGNLLNNGQVGGHAWVEVTLDGANYIMEATRHDVAFILSHAAQHYEPVHYFNDKEVLTVPGRTILQPYAACFSSWLKDYLDEAYIHGRKGVIK